jgi:hypothetical protein
MILDARPAAYRSGRYNRQPMVNAPSSAAPWDASLALGDHESALAAWAAQFAGREGDFEAGCARAEIEERGGDARVVHDGLSAKGHYLRAADAARDAMACASGADAAAQIGRCQKAYTRAFRKYQSISNQGRIDDLTGLEPHPASTALRAHIQALRQERRTEHGARRQRLAALLDVPPDSPANAAELDAAMAESAYARASGMGGDSMASYALGDRWFAAGQALAAQWPASARRALVWSTWFFRRYHANWSAHLPASRWEPDGLEGVEAADTLRASLSDRPDPAEPPAWAREILAGRLPRSLPAAEIGEPRDFAALFELLLAAAPQLGPGDRRWT